MLIFTYDVFSVMANRANTDAMLDVFGVMWTEHTQKLLTDYILLNSKPNHELIQRLLVHVVGMDTVPIEVMLSGILILYSVKPVIADISL